MKCKSLEPNADVIDMVQYVVKIEKLPSHRWNENFLFEAFNSLQISRFKFSKSIQNTAEMSENSKYIDFGKKVTFLGRRFYKLSKAEKISEYNSCNQYVNWLQDASFPSSSIVLKILLVQPLHFHVLHTEMFIQFRFAEDFCTLVIHNTPPGKVNRV